MHLGLIFAVEMCQTRILNIYIYIYTSQCQ